MTRPPKPLFGQACTSCGLCCEGGPCGLARAMIPGVREGRRCPALRYVPGPDGLERSTCGMVEIAGSPPVREAFGVSIGAGLGCDMTEFTDPEDVRAREANLERMRRAARLANREASPLARAVLRECGLAPP